ncbi:hypothetical protein GCM10009863_62940 [Streptomyces axinellae]|uniref:Uncharacterized protein n=1 Tax=Streptomyces axinellae TaxID=552788 RepID=A0ABN3QX27_9ACTN
MAGRLPSIVIVAMALHIDLPVVDVYFVIQKYAHVRGMPQGSDGRGGAVPHRRRSAGSANAGGV